MTDLRTLCLRPSPADAAAFIKIDLALKDRGMRWANKPGIIRAALRFAAEHPDELINHYE